MNINGKKTKEILIGQVKRNAPPLLTLGGTDVERVTTFKLIGVYISDNLSGRGMSMSLHQKLLRGFTS